MEALSETHLLAELDEIIRRNSLTTFFQPIVDGVTRNTFGFEALIRGPDDSPLHSPVTLFETASKADRLAELDFLCRKMSIESFVRLKLPGKLFLNIMPTSMLDKNFREGLTAEFLAASQLSPNRVVIELTEHVPIEDFDLMREALAHYRDMGLQVALDDLGAKYSTLRQWVELGPEFVKIDRHFIKAIHSEPSKRKFLASVIEVARKVGCRMIAEGIESPEEYHCLRELHCDLMQGYYFARPSPSPDHNIASMPATPPQSTTRTTRKTAAILCHTNPPVAAGTPVPAVLRRFEKDPGLRCVAIVDAAQAPIGLMRQRDMLGRFANPFSHALYARQRVDSLMEKNTLVVDENTPIEKLSALVTRAGSGEYEDFVIVDQAGRYRGTGNIIDLLREITELQVTYARQANPLSGLPGNEALNQEVMERLDAGVPFCTVYCDLDNFKAYNDVYGYAKGDEIILATAGLLAGQCKGAGFVGHIGGDDFILILDGDTAIGEAICQDILRRFEAIVPSFYRKEHQQAGGIRITNRQGKLQFFPLLSISLALHPIAGTDSRSGLGLADTLAELKSQAKKVPGNSLFIDQRR